MFDFDKKFRIILYSGGYEVKRWVSIESPNCSNQCWYFKDKETGKMVQVTGTVIVEEFQ